MTAQDGHGDSPLDNLIRIFDDSHRVADVVALVDQLIASGSSPHFAVMLFDVDKSATLRTASIEVKIAIVRELAEYLETQAPPRARLVGVGTRDDLTVITPLLRVEDLRAEALAVADRLRSLVQEHRFGSAVGQPCTLTVSGGVSIYPHDALSGHDLVLLAEGACRRAKGLGRNRCCVSSAGFDQLLQFQLDPERFRQLAEYSARSGVEMQRLMREAIELVLQRHAGLERFADGIVQDTD